MLSSFHEFWCRFGTILAWFASFGFKLYRCQPVESSVVFFYAVVSQIFFTISFFLPLKVVMLLGSEKLPEYLPEMLKDYGRDKLIVALSLMAILFYFVYVGLERLIHNVSLESAMQLSDYSEKFHFVDGQQGFLRGWYERYFRAISGLFFSMLISFFFLWFFPTVFIAYLSLLLLLSYMLVESFKPENSISGKRLNAAGSVFFLLGFICIVGTSWWHGSRNELYLALIGIILLRQLSVRVVGFYSELKSFYGSRSKLDLILAKDVSDINHKQEGFGPYELLLGAERKADLLDKIAQMVGFRLVSVDIILLQSSIRGQHSFAIIANDLKGENLAFILKLYAPQHDAFARSERVFLGLNVPLVTPRLLGEFPIGNYSATICSVPKFVSPDVDMRSVIQKIRLDILTVCPEEKIERKFIKGHHPLWVRLRSGLYEDVLSKVPLIPCFDKELTEFLGRVKTWSALLEKYPRSYINHEIRPHSVVVTAEGDGCCFQWGRWAIDALGCGWPANPKDLAYLEKNIDHIHAKRSDAANMSVAHIKLAALLFEFDLLWRRAKFIDACRLLNEILDADKQVHCCS